MRHILLPLFIQKGFHAFLPIRFSLDLRTSSALLYGEMTPDDVWRSREALEKSQKEAVARHREQKGGRDMGRELSSGKTDRCGVGEKGREGRYQGILGDLWANS